MTEPKVLTEDQKKAAFWTKLLHVQKGVERIPKNGYNDFHKYNYVLEADANEHLRTLFVEHGLVPMLDMPQEPVTVPVEGTTKSGQPVGDITRVTIRVRIVDSDTGYEESFVWAGDGQDSGDKGIYKAMTGGLKFWLLKSFLIPTGGDPEEDTKQDKRNAESERTSKKEYDTVTDAQVKKIQKLAHELGYGADELAQMNDGYVITTKTPAGAAGRLIGKLEDEIKRREEAETDGAE